MNIMFRDAFIVGLCNSLTSVFAGVVVFAILGNLANGRPISEIVSVGFDDHDHYGDDDDDDGDDDDDDDEDDCRFLCYSGKSCQFQAHQRDCLRMMMMILMKTSDN